MNESLDQLITELTKWVKVAKIVIIIWIVATIGLGILTAGYFLMIAVLSGNYMHALQEGLLFFKKMGS